MTSSNKPARCIILTRVSTDAQTDNTSHQTQDEICTRFAGERGWHVVSRFHETESGAMYHTRVDTQAALTMLERDEADILLLYDMTRYGRDVEYQHKMLKRITRARKQLQFTTLRLEYDPYTGELTPESGHIFTTFGSTSALERQNIRRRVRIGLLRTAREGRQPTPTLSPMGYYIVKRDDVIRGTYAEDQKGKYVVVESEAATVRTIFDLYEKHKSVRAVAGMLVEQGYQSRTGANWRPGSLHVILRNPIYKGVATYGRFRHQTDDTRVERGLKKQYRSTRPAEEAITFPAPSIVSVEQWERVNVLLQEGQKHRSGPSARRYMLAGIAFCTQCGRRCYCRSNRFTKQRERRYALRCGNATQLTSEDKPRCSSIGFEGPTLEQLVVEGLRHVLLNPLLISNAQRAFDAQQARHRRAAPKVDVNALQREIEALRRREKAAAEAAVDARIEGRPVESYETVAATAAAKRAVLEEQIAALAVASTPTPAPSLKVGDMGREVLDALGDESISERDRGDLLSTLCESVHPLPIGQFGCAERRYPYKTGGVAIVLKTARPGPYYVVWHRLLSQEDGSESQWTSSLEILSGLPFPSPVF